MTSYVHGDPLTLQEYRDSDLGLRPSHKKLLGLIDTSDPAWPSIAAALREMADSGVEINDATFAVAVKIGTHRLAELDATKRPGRRTVYVTPPLESAGSIVYYIRRGSLIKIGTTVDPQVRFGTLMPNEILAFEPGTIKEERMRQHQFRHLKFRGEHFRPEPELLEHARQLRILHGDPDPTWPSIATTEHERAYRAKMDRPDLPGPASGRKLTAREAKDYLGVKPETLSGWIFRRSISVAGRDDRGRQVFHLEHLVALHNRPASIRARAAQRARLDKRTTR